MQLAKFSIFSGASDSDSSDSEGGFSVFISNSTKVSESLAESHQLQQQLVSRQEESLEYHKELANGIAGAKGNVREMLEEFKVSTVEQKTLIFEVFDRVARLQNLVVSEVSWLYTVSLFAYAVNLFCTSFL